MTTEIKINYYTVDDREHYACWVDGEHDHNGDVPEGEDAETWLAEQFPGATIREVERTQ